MESAKQRKVLGFGIAGLCGLVIIGGLLSTLQGPSPDSSPGLARGSSPAPMVRMINFTNRPLTLAYTKPALRENVKANDASRFSPIPGTPGQYVSIDADGTTLRVPIPLGPGKHFSVCVSDKGAKPQVTLLDQESVRASEGKSLLFVKRLDAEHGTLVVRGGPSELTSARLSDRMEAGIETSPGQYSVRYALEANDKSIELPIQLEAGHAYTLLLDFGHLGGPEGKLFHNGPLSVHESGASRAR